MDLKEIKQIIDLMKRSDLTEFSVEEEGFKLRIRRGPSGVPVVSNHLATSAPSASEPAGSGTVPATTVTISEQEEPGVVYIKSPMVGTFYRSASPENPPFTDVNQKVDEKAVVCIIEAMKIMNEIQAEVRGTILEVLADNGQPVEYGQRLFKVKLAS